MKWLILLLFTSSILILVDGRTRHPRKVKTQLSSNKTRITRKIHHQNLLEPAVYSEEIEEDAPQCPEGCYCQFGFFMDLPISRWVSFMQERHLAKKTAQESRQDEASSKENNYFHTSNEVHYAAFEESPRDTFLKQATCLLQDKIDPKDIISKLPMDLGALTLLYNGANKSKIVSTNDLADMNQLIALEVRGSANQAITLVFEKPLDGLQFANFEFVKLIGNENYERRRPKDYPDKDFNYKPRSELLESNLESVENIPFNFQIVDSREILPYDEYKAKLKKAQMISFYGWKNLEVLRIHSCPLGELHWEMFDGLEDLEHLSLERNDIELITPFALYGAMHIKTLSLAHNLVHYLHYRALAGLLELEWLDLSDNRLEKLSEISFPPFPKLRTVDFRKNPLHFLLPATFLIMNATERMFFGSKDISLELWNNKPFEALTNLRELRIENASVNSLQQNVFKDLISLEKLKIHGKVLSIEFDAFSDLGELIELDMSHCQMRDISMDAFLGVRNLKIINLSHNKLSYLPPNLFDEQNGLEEIYLAHNKLQTLPASFFLQPKLSLARLIDNPWNCSCEMYNWKSKITNQEKGPTTERCISDFTTGKKLTCRKQETYKFERKYTPRCANYKGRSLYYVLRKDLKCGEKQIVYMKRKHNQNSENSLTSKAIPHWKKLQDFPYRLNKDHLKTKNSSKEQIEQKDLTRHHGRKTDRKPTRNKQNGRNALPSLNPYHSKDGHSRAMKIDSSLSTEDTEISNEI